MNIGSVINDRYLLIKEIGHGGYSTIFLALDQVKNKEIALKILKRNVKEDDKNFMMLKQEAMTMAAITSNHIAKIYEFGVHKSNPFIAMEYVKGKIVKDMIKTQGYFLVEEVYKYILQVLDGLEVIHNSGIVHRDIKPANMMKQADGTIVLVDFGTAFISQDEINLYQEDGKTITGTVAYMAPEYPKNPKGTIQTDIYALGVSMFEMFTGKLPYNGKESVDIIKKHMYEPFPSVCSYNSNVPRDFENIIYKCCDKSTMTRYHNVNEMRLDLINAYNNYLKPKKKNIFERIFKK